MRSWILLAMVLSMSCATRTAVRREAGSFSVHDYLKTAYQTLVSAETDPDGHRIRAQLETRAALDALDDLSTNPRLVPYDGPATLSVALELLEQTQPQLAQNVVASTHAKRAVDELRAAVRRD